MKRFLILILFSLFFPIQNSSAVSPSLEETIKFLINGDNNEKWAHLFTKEDWSINDQCILKMSGKGYSGTIETQRYDLNKVIVQTIKPNSDGTGFVGKCNGDCRSDINNTRYYNPQEWWVRNGITWERNVKALSHLFSNFCTGAKTAF
tara:strand:- start:9 stop:452 length:444 start_codon:yes stop_codon:yes gene_type:complete